MARKTFNVDDFRQKANISLFTSPPDEASCRTAVIVMLESVLMETGNYKGYRYLGQDELPAGSLPGINKPLEELSIEERFANTDTTRRYYF